MDRKRVPAAGRFWLSSLLFVFIGLSVTAAPAMAQDIAIDWSTQTLSTPAPKVDNTMVVNVRLNNANTLLYSYKIDITDTPQNPDDFGQIAGILTKMSAPATSGATACQQAIRAAQDAASSLNGALSTKNTPVNPDQGNGKYASVKVASTVAYWKATIQPKDDALKASVATMKAAVAQVPSTCIPADITEENDFLQKTYGPLRTSLDSFKSQLDLPHEIVVPVTLSPENNYKIVVTESYKGTTTDGGTQTFSFSPVSNILTLSAGTLLTEVQNRTYASGALPGQTGNFLLVSGTSPIRPILVAQLNYRIPKMSWDSVGFALSSGAALQFTGGNSNVSNVGFFGGVSVYLWRRFYITPGVHVGEFADYPQGFTAPNQSIPPGFGQLNPDKRWTTRFAIGISYKAVDFSKFTSGSSTK